MVAWAEPQRSQVVGETVGPLLELGEGADPVVDDQGGAVGDEGLDRLPQISEVEGGGRPAHRQPT